MTQLYTAFSTYGESRMNAQLVTAARMVPVIGDRIAAALPTIHLPLPEGGLISFYSLMAHYDREGIAYVDMSVQPGFDTRAGIVHNGQAIATCLNGLANRNVTIISHSKGGLDTLQALLENRGLWNTRVTGWVALQSPFHGSWLADDVPGELAAPLLAAFEGDERALLELRTDVRQPYMSNRADEIAELTRTIPVLTCPSSFTTSPSQTIQAAAMEFAYAVFDAGLLEEIVAIVQANPSDPEHATAEATELIRTRADQLVAGIFSNVPMLGLSNLMMQEPNDGLVAVSSTALSGATVVELTTQVDHAAPVMEVTPFKNFWTTDHRNSVTAALVEDVRDRLAESV